MPAAHRALAFSEAEIPLGFGQVMVSPVIEGKGAAGAGAKPTDSVLEIGARSGYFAALLASRADCCAASRSSPNLPRWPQPISGGGC